MYDKKCFPIKYNSDYYDVMANKIIKGKQQMSLQEAKLIRRYTYTIEVNLGMKIRVAAN